MESKKLYLNWPSNLGYFALRVELWAPTDNWSKSAISRIGTFQLVLTRRWFLQTYRSGARIAVWCDCPDANVTWCQLVVECRFEAVVSNIFLMFTPQVGKTICWLIFFVCGLKPQTSFSISNKNMKNLPKVCPFLKLTPKNLWTCTWKRYIRWYAGRRHQDEHGTTALKDWLWDENMYIYMYIYIYIYVCIYIYAPPQDLPKWS